MLEKAKASLLPNVRLESLLKSDLEADLPLHISLSRTLMLATHERQTFTDALEAAIGASGVKPYVFPSPITRATFLEVLLIRICRFTVTLNTLHWVPNYENNRWFLVLQAIKPAGNGLTKLLVASNTVAKRFGQPSLYTPQNQPSKPLTTGGKLAVDSFNGAMRAAPRCSEAHDPKYPLATGEDLSDHFHVSIGWTLERPHETSPSSILNENQLERLELGVHGIKAKIGNSVVVIPLKSKTIDRKFIIEF